MCVHHIPLDRQGRFFYVPCKGCRRRHRLSPRPQAARAGRGRARRRPPRRRAAPYRLSTRARRWPMSSTSSNSTLTTYRQDRMSGALAPVQTHSLHAFRLHRLQHRRRDLGRSRRPQRLCLQSRPRQHRRVRHRSRQGHALAAPMGADQGGVPRFFTFDPAQRFLYVANQDGHSIVGYRVEPRRAVGGDAHPGESRQPRLHRLHCGRFR